ncbi:LacI family DNA-binding transcriptional regulator [Falsibacillus albus]|uniref:LacI family DNA-binding transcriptional regulator n=2 Tax=Falsibacillus albus TaxID=2478915 RepID=A0A3L7K4C6_9BACI|nr:LacI family DNA-binding transcriptional regulator [Falsibacillus albus]
MQDIADHLKISKNSVSQALTGKPGVSEATRKLVETTAEELGYQYTKPRKQTEDTNQHPKNIALIASEYAFSLKSFFGEIYLSIEKEVKKRGMNLFIESVQIDASQESRLPELLKNHEIDGILVLSHVTTDYIISLINTGKPVVLIDHHDPLLQADAILTNNRFGAYNAVKHLIEDGHKEIAFIGDVEKSPSYQERLEGYSLALKRHNLVMNPDYIYSSIKEEQPNIFEIIFQSKELPTAWFCVNDGFGFHVLSGLQQKGISVPDEAAVCSFDNGQLSQISTPKITTMDIDLNYFGRKSVEQLLWRMDHKDEPFQEILLSPELLVRGSTLKGE